MKRRLRTIASVLGVALYTISFASHAQGSSASQGVVSSYLAHLQAGDTRSLDPLFFKFAAIEQNKDDWFALLKHVVKKVRDDQLAWEVICSKALSQTAAVIVNQTMKRGKAHADPDAVYLVKGNGSWLLLPDMIAHNARKEVEKALSDTQVNERRLLRRWAVGEIRGHTSECSRSR